MTSPIKKRNYLLVFLTITMSAPGVFLFLAIVHDQPLRTMNGQDNHDNNNNNDDDEDSATSSPLFSNYCPPPAIHIIEKPCALNRFSRKTSKRGWEGGGGEGVGGGEGGGGGRGGGGGEGGGDRGEDGNRSDPQQGQENTQETAPFSAIIQQRNLLSLQLMEIRKNLSLLECKMKQEGYQVGNEQARLVQWIYLHGQMNRQTDIRRRIFEKTTTFTVIFLGDW